MRIKRLSYILTLNTNCLQEFSFCFYHFKQSDLLKVCIHIIIVGFSPEAVICIKSDKKINANKQTCVISTQMFYYEILKNVGTMRSNELEFIELANTILMVQFYVLNSITLLTIIDILTMWPIVQ